MRTIAAATGLILQQRRECDAEKGREAGWKEIETDLEIRICFPPHRFFTSNLVLRYSPYLNMANATGTMVKAMNPRRELPQPKPRTSYILIPTKGRTAPAIDRTTVLAARALAAYIEKVSTRYLGGSSHSQRIVSRTDNQPIRSR